jgi:protein-L-isoaspartate(D-aspartate) O-methyltransferase
MNEEEDAGYASARTEMVREQIQARDIEDPEILDAMRRVPRHLFVPAAERRHAYRDTPLPLSQGQTISQPYIVALMTQLARPRATDRVLEIGTGSGYQSAILAELVEHVYTIEIEPELARTAATRLRDLGYDNVTVRHGDGYAGWSEHAPFDAILVTAAPEQVPQALVDQLREGGRMIVPVGAVHAVQQLRLIEKDASGNVSTRNIAPVRFVPLRRESADE